MGHPMLEVLLLLNCKAGFPTLWKNYFKKCADTHTCTCVISIQLSFKAGYRSARKAQEEVALGSEMPSAIPVCHVYHCQQSPWLQSPENDYFLHRSGKCIPLSNHLCLCLQHKFGKCADLQIWFAGTRQ